MYACCYHVCMYACCYDVCMYAWCYEQWNACPHSFLIINVCLYVYMFACMSSEENFPQKILMCVRFLFVCTYIWASGMCCIHGFVRVCMYLCYIHTCVYSIFCTNRPMMLCLSYMLAYTLAYIHIYTYLCTYNTHIETQVSIWHIHTHTHSDGLQV